MKNLYFLITMSLVLFTFSLNAQWEQITGPNGGSIRTLAGSGINLFAGIESMGIFVSTDDGNNWEALNSTLTYINVLSVSELKIFAATFEDGYPSGYAAIHSSTDFGASWQSVTLTDPDWTVTCFAIKDSNVFVGLFGQNGGGGISRSTNSGESWEMVYTTPTAYSPVNAIIISDSSLFAGTGVFHGLFLQSNDNGNSWEVVYGSLGGGIWALALSEEKLFAGTTTGVFLSTDQGINWTPINDGLPDYVNNYGWITSLNVCVYNSEIYLFAGTNNAGLFLSTNFGSNWSSIGLSNNDVYKLTTTSTSVFAITDNGTWRCALPEIITSVANNTMELPNKFSLMQNYPNPFNPSTTIRYSVPSSEFVTLKIFDVLGNEVATLVNEEKTAGSYEVQFDSHSGSVRNLTSGVYFYTLQAGSYKETKKLILIK